MSHTSINSRDTMAAHLRKYGYIVIAPTDLQAALGATIDQLLSDHDDQEEWPNDEDPMFEIGMFPNE